MKPIYRLIIVMAGILLPADNSYVTGPVQIIGNASDANLESYQLEISPGTLDDTDQWSQIGEGDAEVSNALLLDWLGLPPDGDYVLRLKVEDKAENVVRSWGIREI